MEEKKYAFYTAGRNVKPVIDMIKCGEYEQLRIGEITQKRGDDISYHGTPIYEDLTTIRDIESGEIYQHGSHNKDNIVDFVRFSELERELELHMKTANKMIDEHIEEIKKLQEMKVHIKAAEQELADKMFEIQPEGMLMKME